MEEPLAAANATASNTVNAVATLPSPPHKLVIEA